MSAPINAYGDKVIGTSGSHGSDISSQRMDDLDKAAIYFVMNGLPAGDSAVCDIGCGAGSLGFRLSLLGARVEMYDLVDISSRVAAFRKLFPECSVQFYPGDARQTFRGAKQPPLGAAYSQRFIHYMPYQDAKALFIKAAREMTPGAKFFVSASGLDSELGDGYAGKALPLMGRFHALSADMAEKHEIKAPVCLYREEDIARLAQDTGFEAVEIWASPFGNIKGILCRQ